VSDILLPKLLARVLKDSGSYVEGLEKRAEKLDNLLQQVCLHFSGFHEFLLKSALVMSGRNGLQ